ncbi:phosphoribosyltransferase [Paludibacter sp.]|uniref:phosphoribosyltransferase n=1 Tax=Paludibacter sp. TaxID=1898105 RepID=UPI001354A04A|nr:phosphoribosyltransferase [Paludibacter sp.]MTK53692.1 phosphoribosyltransferase [Paludibacter sp.]
MEKDFNEIQERVRVIEFNEQFDLVIAIANGATIPAELIRQKLGLELFLLKINLRDSNHVPVHSSPVLLQPIDFDVKSKRILLVEDRVKTGKTVEFAKCLLLENGAAMVKTLAVNGNADYFLYNETCFRFPWIL